MKIGITDYAEKYIEEHTIRKKFYSEESYNKLKQKLEAYENMRKEAIECIDLIKPELWNISNKMTYKLLDIKNILNKVGESNETFK